MTSIAEVRPESERIEYLLRRDGYEKTRKWVERTIAIYRAELDHGHQGSDPAYRPRFEKAVCEFEKSLAGAHCYRKPTDGSLMITSTRRFCSRPAAESFPATGSLSPLPDAASRVESTPCPIK
jgi:hypothetical protein